MAGQLIPYTGTVSGVVGSLITALDAILVTGAGWTKSYSGANKAAYYSGAATNPVYLRVDDSGPGAGGAKEARITGYETMSDVDTGTGPFPTVAVGIGGALAAFCCRKSASADATARTYLAYADAATIYFFCLAGDIAYTYYAFGFGAFDSKSATDTWRNFCVGRSAENQWEGGGYEKLDLLYSMSSMAQPGFAGQRSYTGVADAIKLGQIGDTAMTRMAQGGGYTNTAMGLGILPYPNNPDSKIYIAQVRLFEASGAFRGTMRGLWSSDHPVASFNDGDTFTGAAGGTLAGKSFRFVKSSGNAGLYCVETSATLSTP